MEFPRLLRHHFVRKPVVVSQNVGHFLRLGFGELVQSLVKYVNKQQLRYLSNRDIHPQKTPWVMLVFGFASYFVHMLVF